MSGILLNQYSSPLPLQAHRGTFCHGAVLISGKLLQTPHSQGKDSQQHHPNHPQGSMPHIIFFLNRGPPTCALGISKSEGLGFRTLNLNLNREDQVAPFYLLVVSREYWNTPYRGCIEISFPYSLLRTRKFRRTAVWVQSYFWLPPSEVRCPSALYSERALLNPKPQTHNPKSLSPRPHNPKALNLKTTNP